METKIMSFIATIVVMAHKSLVAVLTAIFAMIHKNLAAFLTAVVVLVVGTMMVLMVTIYGLSSGLSFFHSNVLFMSIISLAGVGVIVYLSILIFKKEKALPTSEQNSLDFKVSITFLIFFVVMLLVLFWFIPQKFF